MHIADLKQKKIAILGFGINNFELTFWLLKHDCQVTICDRKEIIQKEINEIITSSQLLLLDQVKEWRVGKSFLKNLTDFDLVFRTPGIPYLTSEIQSAQASGVKISSQTELFLQLAPCKVIGVTGTKGKSTTAAMIKHLLEFGESKKKKVESRKIYLAGNIGKDPFVFIDELTEQDIVVLELSSFQLQGISVSPQIAVVNRMTADHLNHHRSLDEYYEAKVNITRFQKPEDFLVINTDEPISQKFQRTTQAKIIEVSSQRVLNIGVYLEQGSQVKIKDAETGEEGIAGQETENSVKGKHNLENWALACGVGHFIFKISIGDCRQAFDSFSSLPYRLQFLKTIKGVDFYNDSYSTNPDSTVAALESFKKSPLILICGGAKKSADFFHLAQTINQKNVKAVVGIGEEGPRIIEEVKKIDQDQKIKLINSLSLSDAFKKAWQLAKAGEVILLSPACASFGEFKNALERGQKFTQLVSALKK